MKRTEAAEGGKQRAGDARGASGARADWHVLTREQAADALGVPLSGIDPAEAARRLGRFGPNRLEPPPPPSPIKIFLRQFRSPLIYVLLAAAVVSLVVREYSDAGFIGAVLLINALIGYLNEYRAEREVQAMLTLVPSRARVHRGGRVVDIDGEQIVPGDLLLLESGNRVGADTRLIQTHALRVDESLLTGESVPVTKDAPARLPLRTPLADRTNMAFAGSMVANGRGMGLVVGTGRRTEMGAIAGEVARVQRETPPLLRRMESFARWIGAATLFFSALVVVIGLLRGHTFTELLLVAIALAVAAIPEGLPIALTVALAVAVSRMAKRRVLVRNLPAVEALGSCGVVATDKTGTLTENQLTVERIVAGKRTYRVTGVGYAPEGSVIHEGHPALPGRHPRIFRLLRAAALENEASLTRREGEDDGWQWSGDPTDVAILSLVIKAGLDPIALTEEHELAGRLPFEPEHRYAASFNRLNEGSLICVKGAPERVLGMCVAEIGDESGSPQPLDPRRVLADVEALMQEGYRVIAVADAESPLPIRPGAVPPEPSGLTFLGLLAMTDPPREGVEEALRRCAEAGIRTVMITGDHAITARAIAQRIGLAGGDGPALTGDEIASLGDEALSSRVAAAGVIARATPADKLRVIRAHQRLGSFVAVTGDGVNDAPALRQANIGVAMGQAGTDVAREAADLIITDDNFSSIVAGVEEGRVAYDNVRKVTYFLISIGAGEVLAVTGALALGLPVPFTAVQLLWLNLVTNGIQDVALAFEPGEPGALKRPPRPPGQGIFDRLMVERTALAGLVFGVVGLACFAWWNAEGKPLGETRNLLLQLFVLFAIFHIGNSRSETRSLFRLSPLSNPFLFLGTSGAVAVHLAAIYLPATQALLGMSPLSLREWVLLAGLASSVILVMEIHKHFRERFTAAG